MSGERLRRNSPMGALAMKITVVGAALLIAAAIVVVLLVRALNNKSGDPGEGDAS
jgi:hypothetical protein